jgi:hypothetical protein
LGVQVVSSLLCCGALEIGGRRERRESSGEKKRSKRGKRGGVELKGEKYRKEVEKDVERRGEEVKRK